MHYDLTKPLLDHRGEPITETTSKNVDGVLVTETKAITLGLALERACISGGASSDSAERKFGQFKLAQKLTRDTAELAAEEVARLKELAAVIFSPIGLGAVYTALENPGLSPTIKEAQDPDQAY